MGLVPAGKVPGYLSLVELRGRDCSAPCSSKRTKVLRQIRYQLLLEDIIIVITVIRTTY